MDPRDRTMDIVVPVRGGKHLRVMDACTKLLGKIIHNLNVKEKHSDLQDKLSLIRSEIHGSRFAARTYWSLSEKISELRMYRRHMEIDRKILDQQIRSMKLIEQALSKVDDFQ